ncbi:MAG: DUF5606 domain-containing protein [Bacteroidetes bacterium]|nr:DUF5606 domain-containing protein [Bacteroidota bacterium]MBS1630470.1 DUF5606 domain-containing protein [Bacteroidota bacterium]
MQYREIVSITGLGGLYHLMGTKSDGAIVRTLGDRATKFISSRQHNVTPLESIEIYTHSENVRLHEVFQKMKDSDLSRPSANAQSSEIKNYFSQVYPEMDMDRVYASDMKKMLKWFELLQAENLLDFSAYHADEASEATSTESSPAASPKAEEKPQKKARVKKATAPDETEEKAVKKTARKKSEDATPEKPKAKKKAE